MESYRIKKDELVFTKLSIDDEEQFDVLFEELNDIVKGNSEFTKEFRDKLVKIEASCYEVKGNEDIDMYKYLRKNADIGDITSLFLKIKVDNTETMMDKTYNTAVNSQKRINDKMKKYKTNITKR